MKDPLRELEARLAWERVTMAYPDRVWPVQRRAEGGERVLDVVVIGGGLAGLAISVRLMRMGIANFKVLDENPEGSEGPWITYARMHTLRTEKRLHGPDGGFPSATFRAWYEARFGATAYDALTLIPRDQWMDYLVWVRKVFAVPLVSRTRVVRLAPHSSGFRVGVEGPAGRSSMIARKVIAATGLVGAGGPRLPFEMSAIDRARWKHSADIFDFRLLRGKRVAVLGGNASALDNAATALDHGAARVDQFVRRPVHPERNTLRYLEFAGMFRSFPLMKDDQRLRVVRANMANAVPPPLWSIERCEAFANFRFHMGTGWTSVEETPRGLAITLTDGSRHETDFIILGTGFEVDLEKVGYLDGLRDDILLWRDVVALDDTPIDRAIGRHPYLGPNLECCGRNPEAGRILSNLIFANNAALVSIGPGYTGMNGSPFTSTRVVEGIVESLYLQDADKYITELEGFDHSEFTGKSNLAVAEA
jgi:cation diffusion facilitator CzcD-associated flavoprotein CzcO